MNTRALTAALIAMAAAACISAPSATPTPSIPPTAPASQTLPPTPTGSHRTTPPWVGTPTPAPTVSPTATPPPSATPLATPTATPTAAPTATPTATPTAPPPPQAWPAADRIARGSFSEPAIAIDAAGAVHIAVAGTGSDNRGIWYLTNASGRWVDQQVVTPWIGEDWEEPGRVDEPAIAIDPSDGSVWIAFAFWACPDCIPNSTDGIFYVSNSGGTWSAPVVLTSPGDYAERPSLAVRDGHIYLAWHTGSTYVSRGAIGFGTNVSGAWAERQVAAAGNLAHLVVDNDGDVGILFGAKNDVRYARQKQSGEFVSESLPATAGTSPKWAYSILATDDVTGATWAAWNAPSEDQEDSGVYISARGANGWSSPVLAVPGGDLVGLGVHDGVVHVVAGKSGLTYASNAGGTFVDQVIDGASAYWSIATLAVGPAGRPYVVCAHDTDSGGQFGVWFLKGPAV